MDVNRYNEPPPAFLPFLPNLVSFAVLHFNEDGAPEEEIPSSLLESLKIVGTLRHVQPEDFARFTHGSVNLGAELPHLEIFRTGSWRDPRNIQGSHPTARIQCTIDYEVDWFNGDIEALVVHLPKLERLSIQYYDPQLGPLHVLGITLLKDLGSSYLPLMMLR